MAGYILCPGWNSYRKHLPCKLENILSSPKKKIYHIKPKLKPYLEKILKPWLDVLEIKKIWQFMI